MTPNTSRFCFLFAQAWLYALALTACGGGSSTSTVVPNTSATPATSVTFTQSSGAVVLAGAQDPTGTVGLNGDYYLNASTGRLFGPKTANDWPVGSLLLTGSTGSVTLPAATAPSPSVTTGGTVVIGSVGVTGATGATGINGNTLLSGVSAPQNNLGSNGDFYLNTSTQQIYGPKLSGAWPATGVSLVGAIGATGVAGATGTTGATGAMGAAGATGSAGTTGAPGATGASLLSGNGVPNIAFGAVNDFYINTANNSLIGPKTATGWPSVGISLVGPTGVAGSAGTNGTSILAGAGTPASTLGNNGDLYFDTGARTILGPKALGNWPATGTVLIGAAGPQGPQGLAGSAGPAGVDGKTVRSGTGTPTAAIGGDGDFYIDTSTSTLYGPKSAGIWPGGVVLTGASGQTGVQGVPGIDGRTVLNGATNPLPAQGSVGDFYINTNSTTLFGPKAGSGWPAGVLLIGSQGIQGVPGPTGPQGPTGTFAPAGVRVELCTTGANSGPYTLAVGTRFFYCDYQGGAATGTLTIVLPSADQYAEGTVVTIDNTNNLTGGTLNVLLTSQVSPITGQASRVSGNALPLVSLATPLKFSSKRLELVSGGSTGSSANRWFVGS